MKFEIKHGPTFSVLEFRLDADEQVIAQPNSMLSMTAGIKLRARAGRGGSGLLGGMKSMLGGENFFTVEFCTRRNDQILMLAPDAYGDILTIQLADSSGFFLTRGSYLASFGECELHIKYGGVKGVMAKTGLFLLQAEGQGTVFCQTYGAIVEHELDTGEHFFVDNKYVVAFSTTVQYQLVKATESVSDSLFSGEGLINRFTGPGKVFYQSRAKPSESWLSRIVGASI